MSSARAKVDELKSWRFESAESFSDDLGALGAWVGPRLGADKRTKEQKEEYCLRRFLVALKRTGRLIFPVTVKHMPHGKGPDYVICTGEGGSFGVEVAEAGSEQHQRALTETERTGKPYGHDVREEEVLNAIARRLEEKREKAGIYQQAVAECALLIYDNTQSGGFLDMHNVLGRLTKPEGLDVAFNRVHVLSGPILYFDVFGNRQPINLGTDYDIDYAGWIWEQIERLREGKGEGLDIPHVIEELEDLGKSEKRAFRSQLVRLLLHLLKWRYQPSNRGASWETTIVSARGDIRDLIADNPSFTNEEFIASELQTAYDRAREMAVAETGLDAKTFPSELPFSHNDVFDPDYLPSGEGRDDHDRL